MSDPNWFVGLPVDPGTWFQALPPLPPGVRVFAPSDLHITVAFLGRVERERALRAFEHAEGWPLGPVEVTLGAVVPMGPRRRPSALSAVLLEPEPITRAIEAVRPDMYAAAGCVGDARPARPHVTLARPKRNATGSQRSEALAWARGLELGEPVVCLDRLAVFTWSADRAARLFDVAAVHSLQSAR